MKRTVSGLIVIGCQLLICFSFFFSVIGEDVIKVKNVTTIHNDNLSKVATSISLLFDNQNGDLVSSSLINEKELELSPLPSAFVSEIETLDSVDEKIEEKSNQEEKVNYLSSIDASKYVSNESMGFVVTENNKEYYLEDYEFDVVVAVIAGEFDKNLNDALAVVSVILNRCDDSTWSKWAGDTPYKQVTAKGQFEVYLANYYLDYMPGGSKYQSDKYYIAKQALIDGMSGIRNNDYTGFRAWYLSSYSDKYIVYGGNRYGYN